MRTPKKSLRETLAENEKAMGFYAAMSGKPRVEVRPLLPPKREIRSSAARDLVPSEHSEQRAVIQWWARSCTKYGLPEIALFAIPNGGQRDAITGSRLKAEGVRRGVFDLMLALPKGSSAGLFVEMKKIGGKASPEQKAFSDYLASAGYSAKVAVGALDAIAAISEYLAQ